MIYDDLPVLIMASVSSSQTVRQFVMKLEGNIKSIKIYQNPINFQFLSTLSINFNGFSVGKMSHDSFPLRRGPRKPPGGHRGKGIELLLDELLNVALSNLRHYPDARKIDGVWMRC